MNTVTKLDDIILETQFTSVSHLVDFINALKIPEAKPLQDLFRQAANEPAVFPRGLTRKEFEHKLNFVYRFDITKYKTLCFVMLNKDSENRIINSDLQSIIDYLYIEYRDNTDEFLNKFNKFLDEPYVPFIKPIAYNLNAEYNVENMEADLKELKLPL